MADNTRGIGGLYSSGYGPYQTPTNARFIRRPAANFMTGQTVQNPPIDIFDVTMNPDQFFGGSGTGTFNQTFQGSVGRPGLGSGNPNLGDPTFGGGSGNDGGAGGTPGGGNNGGNNVGGNNGGNNNSDGVIGGGVVKTIPGGGDVDLELPKVKGGSSSDQIKNIILSGVVGLGITEGYNALTGKETIVDRIKDRKIRNDNQDIIDANQIDLQNQFNDTMTTKIDSIVDPIIENNIETKFEEDLYDNLDPDEGLVTDVDGNVIGGSDFTNLDGVIRGDAIGSDRFEEGDPDTIKKMQELRDAGFNATDAFDIIDSLASGAVSLADYNSIVGIDGGAIETASDAASTTFTKKLYGTDADAIAEYDYNVAKDEFLDGEKELSEDGSRPLSSDDDIFSTNRGVFGTDKFDLFDVAGAGANIGSFATSGGATDLLGNATKLVDESALSSVFSGAKAVAGSEIIDFASALDGAETLLSELQVVPGMMLGADNYAKILTGPDAGSYISKTEFIERGGEQAQNILASDLPAEELLTDGAGNMFTKFGTFMGNKDALGIGVSPRQVLGGVGAALNLKSFLDDPKFSSGLGTIAGVQTMLGAAVNPWLTAAIVMSTLLETKQEPSNETGIANLDLGSGEVISYGMGGDKQNDQNVETADTIATAMTPIANEIAETYGVTFEGDIEVGIGNRDKMSVSIGNLEEDSTYMDRLTYNPEEGDLNRIDGLEGQVLTYKYEPGSGEKIVSDLTKNLTLAAQKAVANGETTVNLSDAVGAAPSGEALEQKFSKLGIEDYAIEALTGSAKGYGGSDGILPQFNISYDPRQYLSAAEEIALIDIGLLSREDAAYDHGPSQYGDTDFVGPPVAI